MAAAILTELEAAEPTERPRLLVELRPRIGELAVTLGRDAPELRPIRDLEAALEAYVKGGSQPYETERLWLRVLDLLRALAGASAAEASTAGPIAPSERTAPRPGAFWRRT